MAGEIDMQAQQRAGGCVYTLREPFSDGLYAEAGAMRIPRSHELTMAYIDHFKLATANFTMDNPNGWVYLHGRKRRVSEVAADPSSLGFEGFEHEHGLTHNHLWTTALQPLFDRLTADPATAWDEIVTEYDRYSTREFLEANNWSEAAMKMFGLLADQEALMNSSFLELLREEAGRYYTDMVEIVGGMDHLPRAFLPALRDHIRFGARLVAIEQAPESVTVHYQTAGGRFSVTGDELVVTVPFPVLRHVEVTPELSRGKQRAIRQLHDDASAKILLQFRNRFWEEVDGIFGGGTFTDLPIRVTFYPSTAPRPAAASSSPATPGRKTPSAGDRSPQPTASARRWRTCPASTPKRSSRSRSAHRRCGTTTSSPVVRSPSSSRASRRCCIT